MGARVVVNKLRPLGRMLLTFWLYGLQFSLIFEKKKILMSDTPGGTADEPLQKVFLTPPNPDMPSFVIVPPHSVEGGEKRREKMMDQFTGYIIGAISTVLESVGGDLSCIEVPLNKAQVARIDVPVRRISGEVRAQMTVSLQRSEAKTREVSRATPYPPTPDSVREEIMQILRFLVAHQRTPTNPNGWDHCDRASAYTNAHIGVGGEHTIRLNAAVPDGLEADSGGTLSTSITVAFDECSRELRAELERVLCVGFDFFAPSSVEEEDIPKSLKGKRGSEYLGHLLTNPMMIVVNDLDFIDGQMDLPEAARDGNGIATAKASIEKERDRMLGCVVHLRVRFGEEIDSRAGFDIRMRLTLFEQAVRQGKWEGEEGVSVCYEDLKYAVDSFR